MNRGVPLVVLVLAVALTGTACGGGSSSSNNELSFAPRKAGGLTVPARVEGRELAAADADGFAPMFWAGVNLGSTVPGRQPGEVAATRADYDRWLPEMAALDARVIRIYTILPPAFYDALAAYNQAHPEHALFFIQGVWIPEERFLATGDAYDATVTKEFKAELDDAVAVVHGDARLPLHPGHAGGRYRSDVARWLLAFSIGVEWDPGAVQSTDKRNAGKPAFRGRYIGATSGATPMESWIASMLDHTAAEDAARGWSRPLTFTNWLTLDPLHHAYEPLPQEDLVSLDATHIAATNAWPGGFFASYHAYPYYPDFMRLTPSYQSYERPRDGVRDAYSGYLHALRAHHGKQAVMITEFGIPSSLGIAHFGPNGRDQGNHSEQEALSMDADMLRDIGEEGYAGGVVFEWADEWFKFTWNTVTLEIPPDRRQLWRNDLTNEEHFGVVSAEPGTESVAVLDGSDDEWSKNGSQVVAESSSSSVREVRAVKDEQSLYLRLRLHEDESWRDRRIVVGLDVRPGSNGGLPGEPGVYPQADVAFVLGPDGNAELLQAAWWEPTRITYGLGDDYLDVDPADMRQGSGAWVQPTQIVNKPYTVPETGEERPTEVHELGKLVIGDGDADHVDRRTLVAAKGKVVELRLPWALLGFSDPSSLMLYDVRPEGPTRTIRAGRTGIAVAVAGASLLRTSGYAWEPWQHVRWHERRKDGFDDLARAMRGA